MSPLLRSSYSECFIFRYITSFLYLGILLSSEAFLINNSKQILKISTDYLQIFLRNGSYSIVFINILQPILPKKINYLKEDSINKGLFRFFKSSKTVAISANNPGNSCCGNSGYPFSGYLFMYIRRKLRISLFPC